MKTFTKAKPGKPKGKGKGKATVIDGRQNPATLDRAKRVGPARAKLVPKIAQQISSTPVRHQSGKGTAMVRENLNGVPKTRLIQWLAFKGYDRDKAREAIYKLFDMMTDEVFGKFWGYGENATEDPLARPLTPAELQIVNRYAK